MASKAAKLLPNVRRLFVPDPGHVIFDADLAGADAQVVAWEADDEDLKDAFKRGLKVHHKNAADMWGDTYTSLPDDPSHPLHFQKAKLYKQIKSGVHGTNYGASARTLAITLGWTVQFADAFQKKWFALHPGILTNFHEKVRLDLETTRRVTNRFGFHRIFFDRIDSIFPEALAWKPQSTVATTSFKGALQVRRELPWVRWLLQNHDSLVGQIPKSRVPDIPLIHRHLRNTIPYPDPLIIPWGLKVSDKSWGDCVETTWEEAATLKF